MPRPCRHMVWELTDKSPGELRPHSIKALVIETLRELRVADETQLVYRVIHHKDFRTRQADPARQVRWYLWHLRKQRLLRALPDRRWRPRSPASYTDPAPATRERVLMSEETL